MSSVNASNSSPVQLLPIPSYLEPPSGDVGYNSTIGQSVLGTGILRPVLGSRPIGVINVSLVIDDSSHYEEPDSYFYGLMQTANESLKAFTGVSFNVIRLTHMKSAAYGSVPELQAAYLRHFEPPEYLVIFSKNDEVTSKHGGYGDLVITRHALKVEGNANFCNRLNSTLFGKTSVLVAVADAKPNIFLCGYGDSRFVPGGWTLPPVSSVSIDDQCHALGVPCVFEGGASRCSNWRQFRVVDNSVQITDLDKQYAAGTVVHELLHPFGTLANLDHFGTPACINRTSNSINWSGVNVNRSSENFFGICPDLYTTLQNSYSTCP